MNSWLDLLIEEAVPAPMVGAARAELDGIGLATRKPLPDNETPSLESVIGQLESAYLDRMRATRRKLRPVRWAFATRDAAHLRCACWAAVLLAAAHRGRSARLAEAWSRRAALAYRDYRAALVPGWVRSVVAIATMFVTVNPDEFVGVDGDALHNAVHGG